MERVVRLPAEWERQAAVLLTWPRPDGAWGNAFAEAEQAMVTLAATIARFQPVVITVPGETEATTLPDRIGTAGGDAAHIRCHIAPADDIWARDHGPITMLTADGQRRLLDFTFNGWGDKHAAAADNALTASLHDSNALGAAEYRALDIVLEGGAIDTDGAGTLLTTSQCLLHPGRNPGRDRTWYEAVFARELGIRRVLWLDHGWLAGDDTDGHVDMLARFVDGSTIAYTACDDPDDPHYRPLRDMEEQLANLTDSNGAPYSLVPLPWPAPVTSIDNDRLPATYANFLILNNAVLVPAYGIPQDEQARMLLADLFPSRDAISLDARVLIGQGGALHCAAMQIPA